MAGSTAGQRRPYVPLGNEIATRRTERGWTQKRLAQQVGYGEKSGYVTIAKIEGGLMRPSDDKLMMLAAVLEVPVEKLQDLAGGRRKFNPLAGAQLHRANQRRVAELNIRTQDLQSEVDRHFLPLQEARKRVEQNVLDPVMSRVARLRGADVALSAAMEEVGASRLQESHDKKFTLELATYREGVARSMTATVGGAAAGGAAAGGAVGAGAAFATYSAVAAWASASTGTAIAGLSGAAASSATMAALGGGSLAAGGFGAAGGAAVLAGIIAAPAMLAAGVALFIANKKWAARQGSEADRLDAAERDFNATERRVRESFAWASRALGFLSAAEMRAAHLLNELGREHRTLHSTAATAIDWDNLNPKAQTLMQKLLQLAAVTATVMPLPVMPTPADTESADKVKRLEAKSKEWNEAVLAEAMAWFAIA